MERYTEDIWNTITALPKPTDFSIHGRLWTILGVDLDRKASNDSTICFDEHFSIEIFDDLVAQFIGLAESCKGSAQHFQRNYHISTELREQSFSIRIKSEVFFLGLQEWHWYQENKPLEQETLNASCKYLLQAFASAKKASSSDAGASI